METTINEMTAERSLEIIRRHIEQSRKETTRNMGTSMIWWGSLVLVTALTVGYLWKTSGNASWNFLWFLMAIIGIGGIVYLSKKDQRQHLPRTFISSILGYIWLAFGIFACILPLMMYVAAPMLDVDAANSVSETPIVILLVGLCTTITGLVLKNHWITTGGIISGTVGTAAAYLLSGTDEMLVMAGVALVALTIPGILINLETRKDV